MELIFHEKQEGALCAQHCLNALLQAQYFSAVDLAEIAERLDVQEREYMAEGGIHTEEYQQFLQQPSNNFDDSGFFSVQVISHALRVWGLDMMPFNSQTEQANEARTNPKNERAFICNFRQHWFAVRKLGHQWFNLNSLLCGPELVSDTFLSLFLTQLQQEGYSIFIIKGRIPECEADELLRLVPAVQPIKPNLLADMDSQTSDGSKSSDDIQALLEQTRQIADSEDIALQRALKLSMEGYIVEPLPLPGSSTNITTEPGSSSSIPTQPEIKTPSAEEVRQKRLGFYCKQSNEDSTPTKTDNSDEPSEEELLKLALEMSMQPTDT